MSFSVANIDVLAPRDQDAAIFEQGGGVAKPGDGHFTGGDKFAG
jgi:hypothetical protein